MALQIAGARELLPWLGCGLCAALLIGAAGIARGQGPGGGVAAVPLRCVGGRVLEGARAGTGGAMHALLRENGPTSLGRSHLVRVHQSLPAPTQADPPRARVARVCTRTHAHTHSLTPPLTRLRVHSLLRAHGTPGHAPAHTRTPSFVTAYQYDWAYGGKMERIKAHAAAILAEERASSAPRLAPPDGNSLVSGEAYARLFGAGRGFAAEGGK